MNRRAFLSKLVKGAAATAAVALAVPDELFTPEPIRTYFLPPANGWKAKPGWNQNFFPGVDWAKGKDGSVSIQLVKDYNIETDRFPMRFDVLYGYANLRPE